MVATLQTFFDHGITMRLPLTIPGGINDEIEIPWKLCTFDERLCYRKGSRGFFTFFLWCAPPLGLRDSLLRTAAKSQNVEIASRGAFGGTSSDAFSLL